MASSSAAPARAVSTKRALEVPASAQHSATVIFFHGLGDQGDGWASVFAQEIRLKHVKYIFPHANTLSASMPVTLNMGMSMPSWYDIHGLTPNSREDDVGIEAAKNYAHSLIDEEVKKGIAPNRIVIGGFSMGGALAIYAGLTYPEKLAGICSLSGFLLQRTKLPGSFTSNLDTPIWLGHGTADYIVPYSFGEMTQAALKKFHSNVTLHSYNIDHGSTPQEHRDLSVFLNQQIP